jgi:beta-hydroxylase
VLGRATATQNVGGERIGMINRLYVLTDRAGVQRKRFKRAFPRAYRFTRIALALALVAWFVLPWVRGN